MTPDDIIRMAREAGFRFSDEEDPLLANHAEWQRQLFERFAALAYAAGAAAEREACAKVCCGSAATYAAEARRLDGRNATHAAGKRDGANECAAAIRARGQA
jgi:O6-methylguanine-DNA--protein-cysteine methyltransferase